MVRLGLGSVDLWGRATGITSRVTTKLWSVYVWYERCCTDQSTLTLFPPTQASWLAPGCFRHFLNHSDCCFIPFHPCHYPYPSPHHIPTLQALEGAPSDQLMQQSQMPQYYTQQPWVPKTSASSLSYPSQLSLCSATYVTPFSHLHHHTWPPSVSAVSHCRCFISEGAFFPSHFIPTTS